MSDGQILILTLTKNNKQFAFFFFALVSFLGWREWKSEMFLECCDANDPIYQCRIIYKAVPCEFFLILFFFFFCCLYCMEERKTALLLVVLICSCQIENCSPAGKVRILIMQIFAWKFCQHSTYTQNNEQIFVTHF